MYLFHGFVTEFDLEKERSGLDEQGLKIAENQEVSQKNRRKLAESTRGMFYAKLPICQCLMFPWISKDILLQLQPMPAGYLLLAYAVLVSCELINTISIYCSHGGGKQWKAFLMHIREKVCFDLCWAIYVVINHDVYFCWHKTCQLAWIGTMIMAILGCDIHLSQKF